MRAHQSSWSLACLLVLPILLQGCGGGAVRPDSSEVLRREIVTAALSQLGTPYRWGGASPGQGFDCSGLVLYTHDAAGIRVPRIAAEQFNAARTIGTAHAKPGDLVFFKLGPADYHVGILVEPDRFVHAPRSGKDVRLAALNSPYWSSRFLGAATFL